jgi:hypothetical protein
VQQNRMILVDGDKSIGEVAENVLKAVLEELEH